MLKHTTNTLLVLKRNKKSGAVTIHLFTYSYLRFDHASRNKGARSPRLSSEPLA